jgi:uncharacterized membrane protein
MSSAVTLAVVVVGAALALYVAHLGDDPEAGGAALLVARAVQKLQLAPMPYTPALLRSFVELVGWLAALAALAVPARARLMGAAVSLALVARGNLELPLCAVALVIAALVLAHHPGPDLRREIDLLERNRERLAKAQSRPDDG